MVLLFYYIDGDCIEGHNHNILSCGPCCDLPAHSFHLPDRLWQGEWYNSGEWQSNNE